MAREFTFSCPLPSGLHARPAAQLADRANHFSSEALLVNLRSGAEANLKSPLAIIAANVRFSDRCSIRVTGTDQEAAVTALRSFVEHDLPSSDNYLPPPSAGEQHKPVPRILRDAGADCLFGRIAQHGIGIGKVVRLDRPGIPAGASSEEASDREVEHRRMQEALARVQSRIREMLLSPGSQEQKGLVKAQLAIATDLSLVARLEENIAQGKSAGQAAREAGEFFLSIFRKAESAYLRERALDFEDVLLGLLEEIEGRKLSRTQVELSEPSVAIAETLSPQQLLSLNRQWLRAVVLENASTTSHGVILARSLGFPTLVGVKQARQTLFPGQDVVADGNRGLVVPISASAVREFYEREAKLLERRSRASAAQAAGPARTQDGRKIEVAANVATVDELAPAFAHGADGIGLFRTEMLLVGEELIPSEEAQFEIYARAARLAGERPVIIRTLDIGGDKPAPQLHMPKENNPFLGYRGVRIYPDFPELVRTQVRAILRASALGRVQIMIPMVSSLEEVQWVKAMVEDLKRELKDAGLAFDPLMPLGIMVETPAIAFMLDALAKEMDFFSIGTNDLCQYFFAAERGNDRVASLAQERHPAFLKFLKEIVSEVSAAGKPVSLCGDMAADVRNLPLLIGLGLDEISVPAPEIPGLKQRARRLSAAACENLLSKATSCRGVNEVDELLGHFHPAETPQSLLTSELVEMDLAGEGKQDAIRQISQTLYLAGRTDDAPMIEEALCDREAVSSTSLGYGFAIPHCKTDAVTADSVGIFKLSRPILWGSDDDEPVRMIILLAVRESQSGNLHLQILSRLARKLMDEKFRDRILACDDALAVVAYLSHELGVD